MNSSNEVAEILLKMFNIPALGTTGAIAAAALAAILSGVWIYVRRMMRKSERKAANEHNRSQPSKTAAESKTGNQSASKEWKDAQDSVDDLMDQDGEGTVEQPSEPEPGMETDEGGE